jgi:hypothetical protein
MERRTFHSAVTNHLHRGVGDRNLTKESLEKGLHPGPESRMSSEYELAQGNPDDIFGQQVDVTCVYCGNPVLPAALNGFDIAFRGHVLPLMHPRRVAEADEQTLRAEEPGDGLAPWLLFGSMDEFVPFRL